MTFPGEVAGLARRAAVESAAVGRLALRQLSTTLLTATDGRDVLWNDPDGWEVERPELWWTGPKGSNGAGGGPWGNPIPGAGNAYTNFGGIPAVARCTSLVVDTLAALPWHVYRGTELRPTPDWITDPQSLRADGRVIDPRAAIADETRLSAMDLWAQWLVSALWFGDGFMYVPNRDAVGAPAPPLFVLPPTRITLRHGRYWFGEGGDSQEFDSAGNKEIGRPFGPGEIIHLRGLEPLTDGRGSGVLSRFAAQLGYGLDIQAYGAGVFGSGVPSGYLKTSQPYLDQPQADALKVQWMSAHGGPARGIAILNATTEFVPLTFTPVDAELVAVGQDFDRHVAMMFGVPAYMLGVPGDSSTYANVESRMIELARFTLLPWAARIEAVLSAQFPRGTSVKIALDALMRADTATRYAAYAGAIAAGFLTVDEARALEDRPPVEMPVEATETEAIPT